MRQHFVPLVTPGAKSLSDTVSWEKIAESAACKRLKVSKINGRQV